MLNARYGVLDLKYSDGTPAVLRHVDGSGFAYYQSGRKAVCISACGTDKQGHARRFSAVLHSDTAKSPIIGVFDEWGKGYCDGQAGPSDTKPCKVLVSDRSVTTTDAAGVSSEVPRGATGTSKRGALATAEVSSVINSALTFHLRQGRIMLDFNCGGVQHSFLLGELSGDEVPGMPPHQQALLSEETMKQLGDTTAKLAQARDSVAALGSARGLGKISSTAAAAELTMTPRKSARGTVATTAPELKDWKTELHLKQLIAAMHPQCPGQGPKQWSIARMHGRCTEHRLAGVKPTAATPRTVTPISQLQLPSLVNQCAGRGQLLVVVCLAAYVPDQSYYAKLVAERAHAELWRRLGADVAEAGGGDPSFRLVAVELAEASSVRERYGIKEVPHLLVFQNSSLVHSKRLPGMRPMAAGSETQAKTCMLLLEPKPSNQVKMERSLRKIGSHVDLALDMSQGLQLAAQRQPPYKVLLASCLLQPEQLRATVDAVRRREPEAVVLAFDATAARAFSGDGEVDIDAQKRLLEECTHIFPFIPGHASLATVLARLGVVSTGGQVSGGASHCHVRELVDTVSGFLDRGRTGEFGGLERRCHKIQNLPTLDWIKK